MNGMRVLNQVCFRLWLIENMLSVSAIGGSYARCQLSFTPSTLAAISRLACCWCPSRGRDTSTSFLSWTHQNVDFCVMDTIIVFMFTAPQQSHITQPSVSVADWSLSGSLCAACYYSLCISSQFVTPCSSMDTTDEDVAVETTTEPDSVTAQSTVSSPVDVSSKVCL